MIHGLNKLLYFSAILALPIISLTEPFEGNINYIYQQSSKMKITIGNRSFTARLCKNQTVINIKEMLPLSLSMTELNGNEKYAELPQKVSISPIHPRQIKAGDLMMYGSRTFVLFYKSFPTSYDYTPIGRIEDISGLVEAVGKGNVEVTFEIK